EHYNLSISQFVFTSNNGIYFIKYSSKNDQGRVDRNLNVLVIPIPPDSEDSQGLIYDIKLYFLKRLANSQ
ncbi:10615_t:CDS:1, partial [Scutellospora calospora]